MDDKSFFEAMNKDFNKMQNEECCSTKSAIVFYAIALPILVIILFFA